MDCALRPQDCDPNASCVETEQKVAKTWLYHQCVCNPGFIGNGITCVKAEDVANGNCFLSGYHENPLLDRILQLLFSHFAY